MEVILGRLLSLNPAGERRERGKSGEHASELSYGKGEGAGDIMQHLPSPARAAPGMSTPWYFGYKSLLHPSRPTMDGSSLSLQVPAQTPFSRRPSLTTV